MAKSPRRSLGFTIVELLVVITVIAILMGLLLPAVQMAREAGRRATCRNNLKELTNAGIQHLTKYGSYPSGGWGSKWMGEPSMGFGAKQPGSWLYSITPFMGAENTFNNGPGQIRGMAERLFHCPTRRPAVPYPASPASSDNPINTSGTGPSAKTDYAANGGAPPLGGEQFTDGPGLDCLKNYNDPNKCKNSGSTNIPWDTPSGFNGVSFRRSQVLAAHVDIDGASQTLFAAEKFMNSLHYTSGQAGSDRRSVYQGYSSDTIRFAPNPMAGSGMEERKPKQDYKIPSENPTSGEHTQRFGSAHSAGFFAAFCDGSVHLLNYSIDGMIFGQLGTTNDKKSGLPPVDVSRL